MFTGGLDVKLEELKIPESGEKIVVDPGNGGTVVSLILGKAEKELLRNDSEDEYLENPLFRGRFLFPFNDRIPEGKYNFQGVDYQLPVNNPDDGSSIHGFMYNKKVEVLQSGGTDLSVRWHTVESSIPGYPFALSLTMDFHLSPGGLNIDFTVRNEGRRTAPFALGWHSYFLTESCSKVIADFPCFFDIDSSFLPVGDCIPAKGPGFDFSQGTVLEGKSLDHTFVSPRNGTVILDNREYRIRIVQENFPFTQLYIPPEGDSIAIEPITSKPNSFNSSKVLTLSPGNVYTAAVRIECLDKEMQ